VTHTRVGGDHNKGRRVKHRGRRRNAWATPPSTFPTPYPPSSRAPCGASGYAATGADPHDGAVPGWIERDEHAFQLVHAAYVKDHSGRIVFTDGAAERTTRVFQMEGPPLPFPTLE
jgi:hypothetical protein